MSSVPTNMAKKKSRDVTCKPAIIDDLPQEKLKTKFWRADNRGYYGIFEKRPITESLFSAFLSFLTRLYFNSHANDRTK